LFVILNEVMDFKYEILRYAQDDNSCQEGNFVKGSIVNELIKRLYW